MIQPKVIPASQGANFSILGSPTRMILSRRDTADSFIMFEQSGPPGVGVPMHIHTHEDEIFRVLEGQARFVVDNAVVIANPGDTLYGPRNIKHEWFIVGDKPGKILFTAIPGTGFEEMLMEISRLPAGPPDLGMIATICGKAGISFVR